MCGGMPRPARVVQHRPRERDGIGLAVAENGLCMVRFADQADGDDGHPQFRLQALGKRHLISGCQRYLLFVGDTPGTHVERGAAPLLQRTREHHRTLDVPTAGHPVGRRDAHPYRPLGRKGPTHRLEDLERKPHPVFERSPVRVTAPVRDG